MAARKSSRGAPRPNHSHSNPVSADRAAPSLPEPLRHQVESVLLTLRDIEGTVIVVAGALREEQEFVGMCTARLLRTQVSNRLSAQIDRLSTLFNVKLKTDREYDRECA